MAAQGISFGQQLSLTYAPEHVTRNHVKNIGIEKAGDVSWKDKILPWPCPKM